MESFLSQRGASSSSASTSSSSSSSSSLSSSSSAAAASARNDRRPADITVGLDQPSGPIVKWVWLISKTKGNNLYQCRICHERFTGQPSSVGTHFDKKFSTQRVLFCVSVTPTELREELDAAMAKKKKSEKRDFASMSQTDIAVSMKSVTKPLADSAILQFIVTLGLSPSIVEDQSFRMMVTALRDAGPNYVPPKRHAFGLDNNTFANTEMQLTNP